VLNIETSSFSLSGDGENFDFLAYASLPENVHLLAIADGVGSAQHGGDAARLVIKTCTELGMPQKIPELFAELNSKIQAAAGLAPDQWSTTLSACWITENTAVVGHVGDTRIYHLRNKGLQTRTRDQTEVAKLIEEGVLSRERALRYPRRNVLLSSLNGKGNFDLFQCEFSLQDNDRLLLLSDGVYKQVTKQEIVSLSLQNHRVEYFVKAIENLVIERGLIDDASAICAEIHYS